MPTRAHFPVVEINKKKLRSLNQEKIKSAVETAQQGEMSSMSKILVEESFGDGFITGYLAATDRIKDSFFSLVESVVTEMIYSGVLN